jgi:hypothetical protein
MDGRVVWKGATGASRKERARKWVPSCIGKIGGKTYEVRLGGCVGEKTGC